jgi:hypothetical protein
MLKVFFVYVDRTDDGRPFYVGKGLIKRTQTRERNLPWKRIASKYGWRREVVLATRDESFAFEEEKRRIVELGTFEDGTPGRWGANLTEGGEGSSGWKPSVDWLVARSGSNAPLFGKRGKQHPYFGRNHTAEWLENHRGEKHPAAKVTEREVVEIREKYASGMYTQKELGMSYGITQCVVSCLIRGKNWKHVPKA